jgi:hypothetical protein
LADRTDDIREKRLISKIYFIIFPFFKDLAVLYREKCIKGRVQHRNFLTDTSSINGSMADSFLDWCKARETAAHSRFKRRGHKKKYAAEE